jgi:hypothetical protein
MFSKSEEMNMKRAIINVAHAHTFSALLAIVLIGASGGEMLNAATSAEVSVLADALVKNGCARDSTYRTTTGVTCGDVRRGSGTTNPDDALRAAGDKTLQELREATLKARGADAACSQGVAGIGSSGTFVGPRTTTELAQALVHSAMENVVMGSLPVGMVLSIPGVTQVQYEYRGLSNGPEVRTFKISGQLEGTPDDPRLRLNVDGDIEGDKNLYVEYAVNYRKSRNAFPAWSPFLDEPGKVSSGFIRRAADTLPATASFFGSGEHRNGIKPWQEYEYTWHAEKVGGGMYDGRQSDVGNGRRRHPYGGDWVGVAWGSETRFKQGRTSFVAQFSPALARTMKPEEGSEGVVMTLNVKHHSVFYLHIDDDGSVSGRGTITYTLDPNLCAVAVLTRQVNERINFMKYLPAIYLATREIGSLVERQFQTRWTETVFVAGRTRNLRSLGAAGREQIELQAVHLVKPMKGFPAAEEFAEELTKHRDAIQDILDREGLSGLQDRIREYQGAKSQLNTLRDGINSSLGDAGQGRAWSHYPDMVVGADPFAIGGTVDARINSIVGACSRTWAQQILALDPTQGTAFSVVLKAIIYK